MKKQLIVVMTFLAGLAAAHSSSGQESDEADASAKDDCVQIRSVDGWSSIDDWHIVVRASRDEQYLLTMRTACRGIRSANSIALSNRMGRLCPDDYGRVTFRYAGMRESCRIENVEQVADKDEAKALVEARKSEE